MTPPITNLIINGVPSNIRLPQGSRATHVESDLHDIAARLLDLGPPRLSLELLEHVDGAAVWAVCETSLDNIESLVFRVGPGCHIDALDGRVIERVQFLRAVPVSERLKIIEADIDRERERRHQDASEALYEKLGAPMYANLARLGFTGAPRVENIRPQNKTARRAGRRMT